MKRYKAFLFDLDGVLIDSMASHLDAFNICLSEFGIRVDETDIAGRKTIDILRQVLPKYVENSELERLAQKKTVLALSVLNSNPERFVSVSILNLLTTLKKSHFLALCTSGSKLSLDNSFALGLPKELFDEILTSADVSRAKPDPEIYLTAARNLGLANSDCLVVEDSLSGVQAAISAGCDVSVMPGSGRVFCDGRENVTAIEGLQELLKFC